MDRELIARLGPLGYDLRIVCIHEYAHYFIARHLEVDAKVTFQRNPSAGDNERLYLGRVELLQAPIPAGARTAIALAGVVAEARNGDADVTADEIAGFLEDRIIELSPTDADLAGEFTAEDIERCLEVVNICWPEILAATNAQIAHEIRDLRPTQ